MRSGITTTYGAGSTQTADRTVGEEIGVGYGSEGEYGCYFSLCEGITLDNVGISISAVVGEYVGFEAIAGESIAIGGSASLPYFHLGGGVAVAVGTDGKFLGSTQSFGFGLGDNPLPVGVELMRCTTRVNEIRNPSWDADREVGVSENFAITENSALPGHDTVHLIGVSPGDCARACLGDPCCRSFDYRKQTRECDLSDKTASQAGGLKGDYENNPYDHYSRKVEAEGCAQVWEPVPSPPGVTIKQVAVGSADHIWALATTGQVFRWNGSDWEPTSGAVNEISVGCDGELWATNPPDSLRVLRWDGGRWTWDLPAGKNQVSVGNRRNIWAVGQGGPWRWNESRRDWDRISGGLDRVSVGCDGEVWATNPPDNGNVLRWDAPRSRWTWEDRLGGMRGAGDLRLVAVGSADEVWGLSTDDGVYRWSGMSWNQLDGRLRTISAASDGTVWGVAPDGEIHRYTRSATTEWTEYPGFAVNCPSSGCLASGPGCNTVSVPGQCSFPRAAATRLCRQHPECRAVTCNSDRDDCQARTAVELDPWDGFTSYLVVR